MTRAELALCALVAFASLRGASCLRVERPYPPPTAEALAQALAQRGQRVTSLRAETRMGHRTPDELVRATVRLMARRGGKLRFDALSPMDTPLSTLVADGERFALVDAKANRHYHGPATPCNLARLIGVQLSPDAVLTVLGGATPLIGHRRATLRWDDRAGQEVLTLEGEGQRQTIRVHGRRSGGRTSWELASSEIHDAGGQLLLRIEAGAYRTVAGLRVPGQLAVEQPPSKSSLDVTFRTLELNLDLPAEAFALPAADGLPSERVDCGAPAGAGAAPPASLPASAPAE